MSSASFGPSSGLSPSTLISTTPCDCVHLPATIASQTVPPELPPQNQPSPRSTLSPLDRDRHSPSRSPFFDARSASPPPDTSAFQLAASTFIPNLTPAPSRRPSQGRTLRPEALSRERYRLQHQRHSSDASVSTQSITEPFSLQVESSPFPHAPSLTSSGLVTRITNAISSFSTVLLSPADHTSIQATAPAMHPRLIQDLPPVRPRLVAILDRVSTEVDTECSICLEPQRSMRRLGVCGHMFCADCLVKQMKSRMIRRYDCALCRRRILTFRRPDAS
ncbi:hypothetical protein J1614_008583 [Plenodomus biglobosus]|nr:hypothetical protein J1614_008583 [Plenodomus biglobosus]